jgi:16S rRNA (guanine(966)-N(2))-methyltransferase RsmD
MRIIGGALKGRRLVAPAGRQLRPTSDGLRETLFNVLGDVVRGARVLDAFAGTGAVGLEALSRGATHVTFVERDRRAIAALAENVRRCQAEKACAIVDAEFAAASRGLDRGGFDLLFLDPPYDGADLQTVVDEGAGLARVGGRLVLEHSRRRESPEDAVTLRRNRLLVAGDSALSFYQ